MILVIIFRHGLTERTGATIAMSIVGLRSKDWSRVLDYSYLGIDNNLLSIVNYFNNTFHFDNDHKSWWIDQVTLTLLNPEPGCGRRGLVLSTSP